MSNDEFGGTLLDILEEAIKRSEEGKALKACYFKAIQLGQAAARDMENLVRERIPDDLQDRHAAYTKALHEKFPGAVDVASFKDDEDLIIVAMAAAFLTPAAQATSENLARRLRIFDTIANDAIETFNLRESCREDDEP